jgi:hypothetical protein
MTPVMLTSGWHHPISPGQPVVGVNDLGVALAYLHAHPAPCIDGIHASAAELRLDGICAVLWVRSHRHPRPSAVRRAMMRIRCAEDVVLAVVIADLDALGAPDIYYVLRPFSGLAD